MSTKNNQHNRIRTFLYLIQVQAVPYAVISAISYYRFRGSTPFEIARGGYGQYSNTTRTLQGSHTRTYEEARGVSIP